MLTELANSLLKNDLCGSFKIKTPFGDFWVNVQNALVKYADNIAVS